MQTHFASSSFYPYAIDFNELYVGLIFVYLLFSNILSVIPALEKIVQTGDFDPSESTLEWTTIVEKIQQNLEEVSI